MRRDAWGMSARLAWQRPGFRALALGLLLATLAANGFFLGTLVPAAHEAATAVVHYNVYLGIDDVRPWPWVFLWPAAWQGSVWAGVAAAFGVYQKDRLLAYGVLAWLVLWSLPWMIGFWYLLAFNVR